MRGLADSKVLTTARRELLAARIRERARATAVAGIDPFGVDRWNIYQATRRALRQAVEKLSPGADFVYVDGPLALDISLPQQALIGGDRRCASIAAASILAKVARDAVMARWAEVYPEFGLAANKGYASPQHLAALQQAGPSPHHRFSFAPVREALGLGQTALFAE